MELMPDRWSVVREPLQHQKERMTCTICRDLLIGPHQGYCGCRFCLNCLEGHIVQGITECPACNEHLCTTRKDLVRDIAIEREILSLEVSCPNIHCEHRCRLKELATHLTICEYRVVACNLCGNSFISKNSLNHRDLTCVAQTTKCTDCGKEMTKKELLEVHRNVEPICMDLLCDVWRGPCPYKCGEAFVDNVKLHMSTCRSAPVDCDLKPIGCQVMVLRAEMNDHHKKNTYEHAILLVEEVEKLKVENAYIKGIVTEKEKTHESELNRLNKIIKDSQTLVDALERSCRRLQDQINALLMTLHDRTTLVQANGVWKIEKIAEKINLAKEGFNTQLLGEPFYTGNPGYKIRIKIYPNGDGAALGSHLSVFFLLLKGDYDDYIEWPFRKRISIILRSSRCGSQSRIVNMKPDTNDSCYGRPAITPNVAAGQPAFISHEELLNGDYFVDNGSIIIELRVLKDP